MRRRNLQFAISKKKNGYILVLGDLRLVRIGAANKERLAVVYGCLEGENGTGTGVRGLHGAGCRQRIAVRDRFERAGESLIASATEIVAPGDSIARRAISGREQGFLGVGENVVLGQDLGSIAGIDSSVETFVIVVEGAEVMRE